MWRLGSGVGFDELLLVRHRATGGLFPLDVAGRAASAAHARTSLAGSHRGVLAIQAVAHRGVRAGGCLLDVIVVWLGSIGLRHDISPVGWSEGGRQSCTTRTDGPPLDPDV